MPNWDWWLKTDAGLLTRVAVGCSIFAGLAIIDVVRNGRGATRWREYLFLIGAVALAMAYGAVNDAVASRISWEYFYYGKGLSERLGTQVPPDPGALRLAAIGVGLRATWSAGLIAGVALLIANNPKADRRRVSYGTLAVLPGVVFATAGVFAVVGGVAGRAGLLAWSNPDIAGIVKENLFRPAQFMTVYGMNMGGYAGGIVGTVGCVSWIVRRRKDCFGVVTSVTMSS
jgi:hypothetical protein